MAKKTKKELRKEELIQEIRRLSQEEDITTLSVRQLCALLGISIGGFYHYFNDKSEILYALFSSIDEYLIQICEKEFSQDVCSNLQIFAKAYTVYNMESGIPLIFKVNGSDVRNNSSNYLSQKRAVFSIVYDCFAQGLQRGTFCTFLSAQELSEMFLVLLRGYCLDWAKMNGSYDLQEKQQQLITVFLKGLCL